LIKLRAITKEAKVVELEQDCNCILHIGPHWIHMDNVDRRMNAKMAPRLENPDDAPLAAEAIAREEMARLKLKGRNLNSQGLCAYYYPTKVKTEDGYTFTQQEDGTYSDGDMTFDDLDQLMQNVDAEAIEWPEDVANLSPIGE
jgi:hypothetical protein